MVRPYPLSFRDHTRAECAVSRRRREISFCSTPGSFSDSWMVAGWCVTSYSQSTRFLPLIYGRLGVAVALASRTRSVTPGAARHRRTRTPRSVRSRSTSRADQGSPATSSWTFSPARPRSPPGAGPAPRPRDPAGAPPAVPGPCSACRSTRRRGAAPEARSSRACARSAMRRPTRIPPDEPTMSAPAREPAAPAPRPPEPQGPWRTAATQGRASSRPARPSRRASTPSRATARSPAPTPSHTPTHQSEPDPPAPASTTLHRRRTRTQPPTHHHASPSVDRHLITAVPIVVVVVVVVVDVLFISSLLACDA
jgi:hypothetical protein